MNGSLCVASLALCVQVLVISSKKVGWKKQGTCILVDDQPHPPTLAGYESPKGWKEVKGFKASLKGGDFLFPRDQLLLVLSDGSYRPIPSDPARTLAKLSSIKNYLVWWHHLLPEKTHKANMAKAKK
jgi:hypothetical protein